MNLDYIEHLVVFIAISTIKQSENTIGKRNVRLNHRKPPCRWAPNANFE